MSNVICVKNQQCHGVTLALLVLFLFANCTKIISYESPQEEQQSTVAEDSHVISGPCSRVKVFTRTTADEGLSYPVSVYAFTESGDLQTSQILNSSDDELVLELPVEYPFKLVAVGGNADTYNIPAAPKYSDVISLQPSIQVAQDNPLQMAFADITPSKNEATVVMNMNYQQAALNFVLSDMPDECTAVKVAVSNSTPSISFNGVPGTAHTATFCLSKAAEGIWKTASEVYVIPTQATNTTFTITCTLSDGDHITSATYQNKLIAGTPYNICGVFDKGSVDVYGGITSPEWATPINLSFNFGTTPNVEIKEEGDSKDDGNQEDENKGDENEGDNNMEGDVATVASLPALGTLYDGHFVAGITDSEGSSVSSSSSTPGVYSLLVMSLQGWSDMTAANNTENPTTAFDIAEEYAEGSLDNWRIPTDAEADMLFYYYNAGNRAANTALSNAGASPIVLTVGTSNARYLCNGANSAFNFVNGTISMTSKTANNYYLRLVNTVKVKLQ